MNLANSYSGLRVCDLSQGIAGPHATMLLAAYGADVIKVEPPEGDWARTLGERFGDHCAHSYAFNLGKRSMVLDLKSEAGRKAVHRLEEQSDLVVDSFRPGVAARLSMSYEEARAANPCILYASLSGFGQNGPYSQRGTVDALIQGFSGMMVMNQTPDGRPHRQNMTAVDVLSGLYLFGAVAAAIATRQRTGKGGYIDVSLMQAAAAFQSAKIMEYHLAGGKPKPLYMPAGLLLTIDGSISLSTMRQQHYEALCGALGRTDLLSDPRFADPHERIANGRQLMNELERETSVLTTVETLRRLHAAGVFAERVQSYGDWMQDAHVKDADAYCWADTDNFGMLPLVNIPSLKSPTADTTRSRAPHLGEHTKEIMQELGL